MKCIVAVLLLAAMAYALPDGHNGMGGKSGPGGMMKMAKKMKKKMDMMKNIEFYPVAGPEDECGAVPEETWTGNPMKYACKEMEAGEEACICSKKPAEMLEWMREQGQDMSALNEETGFIRNCGMCKDPCALEWHPMMEGPDGKMRNMMVRDKHERLTQSFSSLS